MLWEALLSKCKITYTSFCISSNQQTTAESETITELIRFWRGYGKEAQSLISRNEMAAKENAYLQSSFEKKKTQYESSPPDKQIALQTKYNEVWLCSSQNDAIGKYKAKGISAIDREAEFEFT